MRRVVLLLVSVALISLTARIMMPAYAGTTGALRGRIFDAASRTPLEGVTVTAASPSQSAHEQTDSRGYFNFLSLAPDTYAVSAEKNGYETQALGGITIFADQAQNISIPLVSHLRTIGRAAARNGGLVRSGTTSDVYSVDAASALAARALSGAGGLDKAYGALASVPGVTVPTGQVGWYEPVLVRGGDYDQVAYEFDGVPVVRLLDESPLMNLSSLGQQELQVYTGGTPATSDSPGLAGYVNQVVKTGSFPGSIGIDAGVGGPTFYHKFVAEAQGATPDRHFSYYVGTSAVNEDFRYGDQFNGASDPLFFYPVTVPTNNVAGIIDGSHGTAPNYGATFAPGSSYAQANEEERDTIANLHFALPHARDDRSDDLQLLYSVGELSGQYASSVNDLGGAAVVGAPAVPYLDGYTYTGAVFGAPNTADLQQVYFPFTSTARSFGSLINPNARDTSDNSSSVAKLQYQHNGAHSYFRATAFSEFNNWTVLGATSVNIPYGGEVGQWFSAARGLGGSLVYADQLSSQHLLTASAAYQTQRVANFVSSFGNAGLGSISTGLIGTNGECYDPSTGVRVSCFDSAYQGSPAGLTLGTPPAGSPAALAGARPLVTENGSAGLYYATQPFFSSVALTDVYRPNEKLTVSIGARLDNFRYARDDLTSGYPARAFWFNAYNAECCAAPGIAPVARTFNAAGVESACPTGTTPTDLTNSAGGTLDASEIQPRTGLTYALTPDSVLRFSYGRFARPAGSEYLQSNVLQQNLAPTTALFSALGYNSPDHDVRPDISNNFDPSLEQHVKGTDLSFKVTPFYRATSNQLQKIYVNPVAAIASAVNVERLRVDGVEFAFEKGSFARDGFAGRLAYTYTNARETYTALPNGLNVIDLLNNYIKTYNAYTHDCVTGNPAICGSAGSTNAAPTLNGIANPYYAQPAQPLLDTGGSYAPYDVLPAPFAGAAGYVVPHVASAIGNYRHGRLAVTPSLTYSSGASYGSPLVWPGYVPQACTQSPSLTPTTPGVSCGSGGYLFIPDRYTGRFDSLGSLQEPSQLTLNLALTFDTSRRTRISIVAANLVNRCYGHGYAWETPTVCYYSSLPATVAPAGNFLSKPPVQLSYPYGPYLNGIYAGTTTARQPFQLTADYEVKL
jgi:hypothetical protein